MSNNLLARTVAAKQIGDFNAPPSSVILHMIKGSINAAYKMFYKRAEPFFPACNAFWISICQVPQDVPLLLCFKYHFCPKEYISHSIKVTLHNIQYCQV